MILIDSSAWVDYLRRTGSTAALEVRRLVSDVPDQVVVCEPIAMELLAGSRHTQLPKVEALVNGLPSIACDPAIDFRDAAVLFRTARSSGRTVRSLVDCLIAAIAIRHDVTLVHKDADFEALAEISELDSRSFR